MAKTRIGDQELQLADDYAAALDAISDRAVINTQAALKRSMLRTLKDLRKYYTQFIDPELKTLKSADGVERRPGSYSILDASAKYKALIEIAKSSQYKTLIEISQSYFAESELTRLERQYRQDFADAVNLGGELGQKLAEVADPTAKSYSPFVGASKLQVEAAANTASAYIRGEIESFRDNIARIVTDGIGRGKGAKPIEADIRRALLGAKDPQGLNNKMGLYQRAELIARSELANAYGAAQKATAARNGFGYVRWIATKDERTCPVCASRHGNIYLIGEVVSPAHPRCRCSISPVATEAVEETDPEIRNELLRVDYWEDSKRKVWESFAKAKEWPFEKASKMLEEAVLKPSPSERRQYPDIKKAPKPVA